MQGKVELCETRLEQRDKQHERLKGFYKRQLYRKEKYAIELRDELNEAKCKLKVIEDGNKKHKETYMWRRRTWIGTGRT